jgi:virginiamycin B lyase
MIAEFVCPNANANPGGITAGSDGNLWYADGNVAIGRITTSGQITVFSAPGQLPVGIVSGPDKNLWFADQSGNIGRITTAGVITKFPVPSPNLEPEALAFGSDGNIWYTNYNVANGASIVGRMTTAGVATELPSDWFSLSNSIVAGPDGNIWFTVYNGEIVRITPAGTETKFTATNNPGGITAASDGNIWVAVTDNIMRITP